MQTSGISRKEAISGVFDRAAAGYGRIRYFPPLGRRLVELAGAEPGARLLDAACGRGAVLFAAAERVGPRGKVIGVDLSPRMVAETADEIQQRGLTNATVVCMDAEHLDFPDASFDGVLCGFGLSFFPNLPRALAEFRRVVRPGGRLAASVWGQDDPRWAWYDDLRLRYQASAPLSSERLDQPAALASVLTAAGFVSVRTVTDEFDWVLASEQEWWATMWSISGRAGLERLAPDALESLRAEVFERMQALREPDGFHCLLQAHLAVAGRPPA